MFPASERNYVASFLTIATGAGIAVGQIMAGTVGPAFGWRLLFSSPRGPPSRSRCCSTPRFASRDEAPPRTPSCGGDERDSPRGKNATRGYARTTSEGVPTTGGGGADDGRRGADDGRRDAPAASSGSASSEEYSAKIDAKKLWRQLKIPSNAIILAQGLPGTVPWGMLNAYFVDFLHVQKGLTVEEGTLAVTLFGAGAACGTVVGGVVGQRVYNRPGGRSAIAVVMGVTTALGALPGYFFLNVSTYGPGNVLLHLSCLVGGVLAAVTPPNVRAVLLNVNPPETRAGRCSRSTRRSTTWEREADPRSSPRSSSRTEGQRRSTSQCPGGCCAAPSFCVCGGTSTQTSSTRSEPCRRNSTPRMKNGRREREREGEREGRWRGAGLGGGAIGTCGRDGSVRAR